MHEILCPNGLIHPVDENSFILKKKPNKELVNPITQLAKR